MRSKWISVRLLLGTVFLAFLFVLPSQAVTLEDGKYEVVVAIDPAMPYAGNETMIDDIKDMMKDASAYLHTALRDQAIFSKVTILIPDDWSDDLADSTAAGESIAGADIFIGNNIGCGACASPGRITIDDGSMDGDTVVHEWGHYRFGLGDEYCDYVFKSGAWYQVYNTSAGWNRCTALQEIERDCDERDMSGAGCTTTTNEVNGAKASIMHRQFNPGIDSFCDDSDDDKYAHNEDVNNHQNRIWSRRSTWSVIESHADGFQYTGGTAIAYVDPAFEVKKASKADIVLVVDVSNSMNSFSRLDNASRAAANFVDRAEEDSYIGIVKFNDTASLEKSLTKITDEASRTDIKDDIPDSASGDTSIGAGLVTAKTELDGSTNNLNQVIVLLTDGEENTDPLIADVIDDVEGAGIKVYAIGLGAASDEQLQDVADRTGGVYYFAQDGDIQALNEAYTDIVNNVASNVGNSLTNETKIVPSGGTTLFTSLIDDSVGSNTIFSFSGPSGQFPDISVTLKQPDDTVLDSSYPGYSKDTTLGTLIYRIGGVAQSGTWTATASNSGASGTPVTMEVTSSRAPEETGLSLFASLITNEVIYPQPAAIFATLAASDAIIRATVTAEVTPPSGPVVTIPLSDDGQGADRFPLDGTYSGYFTQYTGDGRYSASVSAQNIALSAELGQQFNDAFGLQSDHASVWAYPGSPLGVGPFEIAERQMSNSAAEVGSDFERVAQAGAFELTGFVAGDYIPPAKISTLNVVATAQDPPALVLGWIATGDDMEDGTATEYDLRYSESLITEANFSSATQVAGVGPPALAGTEERFTLEGLKCDVPYYFGIKAADEIPNVSELSNVIEGLIHDVTPPVIAAVQATPAALWPANHKLVAVEVSVSASDNCDSVPYCKIAAVTSSESANGNGDGNTEADIFVTGDLSVDLRAERSGKGVGRIYTIEVQCVDAAGNSAYGETQVSVAHDRGRGN